MGQLNSNAEPKRLVRRQQAVKPDPSARHNDAACALCGITKVTHLHSLLGETEIGLRAGFGNWCMIGPSGKMGETGLGTT